MLEIDALTCGYGAAPVLREVSVKVGAGQLVAVVGPNGAGKSTLFKAISGVLQPRAGSIRFDGADIRDVPAARRPHLGIAHVPEGRQVFPSLTVMENLSLGATTDAGRRDWKENLDKILHWLPRLAERHDQMAGTLSGGEQQMLAIGRALMTNPRLLILDEATEGLAPLFREEIWNCLSMLKGRGQSVLVIDKNVANLSRIADRHYIIERGRTVWTGTSEQLIAEPDLQHRYLGI